MARVHQSGAWKEATWPLVALADERGCTTVANDPERSPKLAALEFESSPCHTGAMSTDIQAARFSVLAGRIGVFLLISILMASCGVDIPQIVAGQISTDQKGSTRPLTPSEVAILSDWLAQHRSGWHPNFFTSPAGTVYISLDATSQPAAVRLTLWPGP
jgi:hypothetical protein